MCGLCVCYAFSLVWATRWFSACALRFITPCYAIVRAAPVLYQSYAHRSFHDCIVTELHGGDVSFLFFSASSAWSCFPVGYTMDRGSESRCARVSVNRGRPSFLSLTCAGFFFLLFFFLEITRVRLLCSAGSLRLEFVLKTIEVSARCSGKHNSSKAFPLNTL